MMKWIFPKNVSRLKTRCNKIMKFTKGIVQVFLRLCTKKCLKNVLHWALTKYLYKNYTKKHKNTKFVYILYIKIAQIKTLHNNECSRNVPQIHTYIQKLYKLYKTCGTFKLIELETWNACFCSYKQCTNYTKPIELAKSNSPCMFF